MSAQSTFDLPLATYARSRDDLDRTRRIEAILKRLADSFTEINIATDFLQMRLDPARDRTDLQLSCLVKERVAAIQEQVTELYCVLSRDPCSDPLVRH